MPEVLDRPSNTPLEYAPEDIQPAKPRFIRPFGLDKMVIIPDSIRINASHKPKNTVVKDKDPDGTYKDAGTEDDDTVD